MPKEPVIGCCSAFKQAQQSGTDNEMYGSLLRYIDDCWAMGCDLPDIAFCPWCGSDVDKIEQPK